MSGRVQHPAAVARERSAKREWRARWREELKAWSPERLAAMRREAHDAGERIAAARLTAVAQTLQRRRLAAPSLTMDPGWMA